MLGYRKYKKKIIEVAKILHNNGFVAGYDGNISTKVGNKIIITANKSYKGALTYDDIVVVDINSTNIKGKRKSSSEFLLHKKAYEVRPDANVVIHSHPVYTVLLSIIGEKPNQMLTPEGFLFLGDIPVYPYTTPGSYELAEGAKLLLGSEIVILEKHGVVAVGNEFFDALDIIEKTEFLAKKTYLALISNKKPKLFSDKEVSKLLEIKKKVSNKI